MKLLSIGNSFSQDAQKWLYDVCKSAGKDIYNVNLYYGGCSLYAHWRFYEDDRADYDYEIKGEPARKISLREALAMEEWDVITFQQASYESGRYDKYQPFLCDLYKIVKEACPNAKFYIHETWAYETDYNSELFDFYNRDQKNMYNLLKDAYTQAAESINADVIPAGDVIQYLRENTAEFDYQNGGLSLNRDGFHLTLDYGRYAASLTWYCKLFDGSVDDVTYAPDICDDAAKINVVKNAVKTVLNCK